MKQIDTIIIGASQAGLAVSHELSQTGKEHLVLEKEKIGNGWHQRWDSFCLVTPNWSVQLPGFAYDGDDPDGFMPRDDIVAFLNRYAKNFNAPVIENCPVLEVEKTTGGFQVATPNDKYHCQSLVVAIGAFQEPYLPAGIDGFPSNLLQIDLGAYTNPKALPDGDVLIIGSGQSGCQLAEELHESGRSVVLACGRAPWAPRRIGDRDLVWWAIESGFLDASASELPEEARLFANVLATGHGGGHDLHLRTLQQIGVTLVGRFNHADEHHAYFKDDLVASVAWGDEKYVQIRDAFRNHAKNRSLPEPDMPDPLPFTGKSVEKINLSTFGAVIYTGGFRPDYQQLLPWPQAFDIQGFPYQSDGSSTVIDGLHFIGLHFLRKRKSALLYGVGEDASIVANNIK